MKRPFVVFAGLVLLLVVGIGVFQLTRPPVLHGTLIEPAKPIPDFSLQSRDGPVSLSTFRGRVVVLYFGYTSCPDVCPTTLAHLRWALNELGEQSRQVQVLFVAVDWQKDTPERVASYLSAFHPDFVGLSGSKEQIDAVTKAFGIFYQINPPDENGYYTVDHTATTLVLDEEGRLMLTWPYGLTAQEMLDDLQVVLRNSAGR
ncbi:MAG: SCO family protein [Anaerolineae bacterium]|nr:MAG: SCO family protein [Anaerolineae bacterium]